MRDLCDKLLVVYVLLCLAGCRAVNEIEVFISEHNRGTSLQAEPYEAYKDAFIKKQSRLSSNALDYVDCLLVIRNRTRDDIFICDEEFEIGYYDIELEIKFANNEVYHLKKREGVWYRNLQDLHCIPSGGALSIPITLDDAVWENIPGWTDDLLKKVMDDPLAESPFWNDVSLLLPGREVMIKAILRFVICPPKSPCKDAVLASYAKTFETEWTRIMFRAKRTISIEQLESRVLQR
jgi:hypothetical protein